MPRSHAKQSAYPTLTLLRRSRQAYPESPDEAMLEVFENRYARRDYWITFDCPEFTSLCPVTDQPDFGHVVIRYIPVRVPQPSQFSRRSRQPDSG